MICLKCGNEIKDNEQICSKCGYNKNNINNIDNAYATVNRGIYNPNAVDKNEANKVLEEQKQFDELLQIYIGNKYYNFKKGKFSFCAFLLGPIYFIYRKLYAVGIVTMIITIILNFIFLKNANISYIYDNYQNPEILNLLISKNTNISIVYYIVSLALCIFYGTLFKKFYFNECIERIAKLKHDNKNMGFNELCEIVRKKGGVNKTFAIIFISLLSLPIILGIFIIGITLLK